MCPHCSQKHCRRTLGEGKSLTPQRSIRYGSLEDRNINKMLKETDEEDLACKISDEIKESIRAINVIFELRLCGF